MQYQKFILESLLTNELVEYITLRIDDNNGKTFVADNSNIDYVSFLTSTKLTDEEVHALEPDVWYDFPTTGGKK